MWQNPKRLWTCSLFVGLALMAGLAPTAQSAPAAPTAESVPAGAAREVLAGEPERKTAGSVSVYVPPRVALRDGRFDVVVHFHGISDLQEKNAEESDLEAVIVSVNEGTGSDSYSRAVAPANAIDRLLDTAARVVSKARGRQATAGRVALSGWSAGGAAVRSLIAREPTRYDAVIVADGIFSTFDASGKAPAAGPLSAYVGYAERARAGEALFVLTHTAIDTYGYPSTRACTAHVLEALDLPATDAEAGVPYELETSGLLVRGRDGKGKEAHILEIRGLDGAYARLATRWSR